MAQQDFEKVHYELDRQNLLMLFDGYLSQGILCNLVETLKERFQLDKEVSSDFLIKRIYSVFIELAQNIQNYSNFHNEHDRSGRGRLSIREDLDCFYIESNNSIEEEKKGSLINYFDRLNGLSESEVRSLYREKLREKRKTEYGAGLGFLDIRKKTKNPINYSIFDNNLTISVKIDKVYA